MNLLGLLRTSRTGLLLVPRVRTKPGEAVFKQPQQSVNTTGTLLAALFTQPVDKDYHRKHLQCCCREFSGLVWCTQVADQYKQDSRDGDWPQISWWPWSSYMAMRLSRWAPLNTWESTLTRTWAGTHRWQRSVVEFTSVYISYADSDYLGCAKTSCSLFTEHRLSRSSDMGSPAGLEMYWSNQKHKY